MNQIPTEYIIAALLGLGGAAVWHLFWPVLRHTRTILGLILFTAVSPVFPLLLLMVWVIEGEVSFDIIADMWKMLVAGEPKRKEEKKPAESTDDTLRRNLMDYHQNTLRALNDVAKANVSIHSLEERMDAVENIEHLDGPLAHAIMALAERGGSLSIQTPKVPYGSPVPSRPASTGLPNTTIW